MSTDADAPTPTVLAGRYRLERHVAQGGMAEVWLATDLALSRQVAVKLLKPLLASDPVVAERFRREAIAVASLTHPNIVAVYDAVESDGRQAVVMQYVQGKTLRQLLDEQSTLSPELTVHIGSALAAALDAAHSAGLVHRDVKPGNVLVTPEGRVLLADFGIAKALGSGGGDLTSDNVMMGTAKYLSPEQVRGRRLDGRADLYSLGLVLYECLAGRVPFLGETDADTALARLQRDATDLVRLRPTLPRNLASIVHRLLEREPEARYPTGAAVRSALSGSLVEPIAAPPEANGEAATTIVDRPSSVGAPARTDTGDRRTHAGSPTSRPAVLDPGLTTGSVPIAARSTATALRDRTPAVGPPVRAATREGMHQRRTPSLIVLGVMLVVALVVALVIWSSIGDGTGSNADDAGTLVIDSVPDTEPAAGPARVASIRAFDPEGDDTENDQMAERAVDDDPRTAWYTVCYASPYFGGKGGVGLIVELTAPVSGVITVDVATGPWSVHVFASNDAPDTLEGWGRPVATDFGNTPDVMTVDLGKRKVTNLLVLTKQAAASDRCSSANPHRAGIAEIGFGFD
jgi:eukaryotic-like serine/threonine-protein kinase